MVFCSETSWYPAVCCETSWYPAVHCVPAAEQHWANSLGHRMDKVPVPDRETWRLSSLYVTTPSVLATQCHKLDVKRFVLLYGCIQLSVLGGIYLYLLWISVHVCAGVCNHPQRTC